MERGWAVGSKSVIFEVSSLAQSPLMQLELCYVLTMLYGVAPNMYMIGQWTTSEIDHPLVLSQ